MSSHAHDAVPGSCVPQRADTVLIGKADGQAFDVIAAIAGIPPTLPTVLLAHSPGVANAVPADTLAGGRQRGAMRG